MRKKIFVSSVVMTGLLTVGALRVLPASAQEVTNYPPIIQKLAERFNLNADEVQDVFEEVHEERHAEMEAHMLARLDDLVSEGKITEEQKQQILDKHEEIRAKMDTLKDLSLEERREQMQAIHTEMKAWSESEGINIPFMTFKFGGPHRGGDKGMFFEKLD